MLNSMTGYGRAEKIIDGRDILVEIKSVNHRFFEFNSRIPRAYGYLDEKLKSLINSKVSRGKVEVNVTIYTVEGKNAEVKIDAELAKGYINALREVKDELELSDNLSLSSLMRFQDIFMVTRVVEDEDVIWSAVKEVAEEALEKFCEMKKIEGERMCEDVKNRLENIKGCVKQVEELSKETVNNYKERLYTKIKEVLENNDIDESRVLTEVAIFADKVAVDEETVRLKSHIKQFTALLQKSEPVGKKLDFMVQELNREMNTTGSKCQDISITNLVVDMKAELEKIREQIQNIE